MEDIEVSYETAVKVKEAGFTKKQKKFFDRDFKLKAFSETYLLLEDDKKDLLIKNKLWYAPKHSSVQKWLRNKYDIHVNPIRYKNKLNIIKYKVTVKGFIYDEFFTYDACMETGLYVGLIEAKKIIDQNLIVMNTRKIMKEEITEALKEENTYSQTKISNKYNTDIYSKNLLY